MWDVGASKEGCTELGPNISQPTTFQKPKRKPKPHQTPQKDPSQNGQTPTNKDRQTDRQTQTEKEKRPNNPISLA
jgi:hypothetical protein